MESKVAKLSRLNTKIREGLRSGIDLLVHIFALHLVGRHDVPPKKLVNPVGSRLQQELGHVDVAAVFNDFAVNQLGNLGRGVILRAIELEGLAGSGVVVKHALKTGADIDSLYN